MSHIADPLSDVRLASVMLSVLLLIGAMQFFTLGLVADMIKDIRKNRNKH